MFETVSVDEAIAKGKRTIKYPQLAIFFSVIIITIVLEAFFEMTVGYLVVGMVMAIALTSLYWSVSIVKWQLWAFDNVRNVHSLKKKAVKEQLIWPDRNWLGKTEIWSSEQRKQWAALEMKFDLPDVFTDDLTVPQETLIYYAKAKNFLEMLFMLAVLAGGIYMIIIGNYIWGSVVSLLGAVLAFSEFKEATNTKVQIRINADGIETASVSFCSWDSIHGEDVVRRQSGKNTYTYLIYNYPGGNVELLIGDFKIRKKELEHLLEVYRGRYENKGRVVRERSKSTLIV